MTLMTIMTMIMTLRILMTTMRVRVSMITIMNTMVVAWVEIISMLEINGNLAKDL